MGLFACIRVSLGVVAGCGDMARVALGLPKDLVEAGVGIGLRQNVVELIWDWNEVALGSWDEPTQAVG